MVGQILWGAVSGSAFLTSLAATKSKLAGVPQDRHQVLPLGPPVGRFTLLPIGGGTGNRRLEQPDDKPQVSLVVLIHLCWCGRHVLVHILFFGNQLRTTYLYKYALHSTGDQVTLQQSPIGFY